MDTSDYKSTFSALSENGNTLIPQGKYDLIVYHTTNDGWFGVHKDGKEGVYTKEGRMICDAIYDNAYYHKNDDGIYIEVKKDGKTGVIDEYGKFIITPSSLYNKSFFYSTVEGFNYQNSSGDFVSIGIDIHGNRINDEANNTSNTTSSNNSTSSSSSSSSSSSNQPNASGTYTISQQGRSVTTGN